MKKYRVLILAVILILAGGFYTSFSGGKTGAVLPPEVRDHPLFEHYSANFDYKALTGVVADLNDDGLDDLLVVFSYDKDSNKMVALLGGDEPVISQIEPAPLENIMIELKDINNEPPIEFILSGSKGTYVGYGIYYIEEGRIVNMFDSNMEDCC
ncbi:MAG: Cys-Cys-COOH (seleno)protein SaoC [Bacillota bacterium]|jgi:hypothetical protein